MASDCKLFEQTSERDETSPLNTSGIFDSVRHFSENEEDRPVGLSLVPRPSLRKLHPGSPVQVVVVTRSLRGQAQE